MIKYTLNGEQIEIIQEVKANHLGLDGYLGIRKYYRGPNDEEDFTSEPIYFDGADIFDEIPTSRYDNRIQKLQIDIKELETKRNKITDEVRDLERNQKALIEKFKTYNELKHIEDFISGKITHYVTKYGEIITFPDPKDRKLQDNYKQYRVFSLYGDPDRKIQWKLSEYRDGSGDVQEVTACFSYEEALKIATEIVVKTFNQNPFTWNFREVEKLSAVDKVDPEKLAIYKANLKKERHEEIEKLKLKIKELELL
ncbi:MAG: hypothetical protein BWZ00_01572 [Bacteroidetes bacterium ADurb.BinA174]|nr:MAG: hypothetical protein BWZ00_01572 [Bacteroidetes bacterium ADurb.BinA174]